MKFKNNIGLTIQNFLEGMGGGGGGGGGGLHFKE